MYSEIETVGVIRNGGHLRLLFRLCRQKVYCRYCNSGAGGCCRLLFGGGTGAGFGNSAVPSSVNTNSIGGFSIFASFGPTVGAGRPRPPWNATYCFPSAS